MFIFYRFPKPSLEAAPLQPTVVFPLELRLISTVDCVKV
jgi:hypothetical protein